LELSFDSGAGWLLPIALAAGLITWLHYRKHSLRVNNRPLFFLLGGLRFVALFLAGALLTGPQLRFRQNEIRKPLLIVLSDRSASISAAGDTAEIIRFLKDRLPAIIPSVKTPCASFPSAAVKAANRFLRRAQTLKLRCKKQKSAFRDRR